MSILTIIKNMNAIKKLERNYSGDFGLLPSEMWEIIYKFKDAMEWNDIKLKINVKNNKNIFHPLDYNAIYHKNYLISDIKTYQFDIEIENYNMIISCDGNETEELPLEEYYKLNRRERYDYREFHNFNYYYSKTVINNDGNIEPFQFSNILCGIMRRKIDLFEEKIFDREEELENSNPFYVEPHIQEVLDNAEPHN